MSLKDRIVENRHDIMHAGSYFLWFMAHTFLLCVTAGESWVIINNPAGSSISDTSPFNGGSSGYGSPGTGALLCICVVVSSFGLMIDKFLTNRNLGRALPSIISIALIVVGLLLLTAMSIYTGVGEPKIDLHYEHPNCKVTRGDPNNCIVKFDSKQAAKSNSGSNTNAYDADATIWGWSYGLGWATVWIYMVAGVGYYFGYDAEKDV